MGVTIKNYKEHSCKCIGCKLMCKVSPCFPTPDDFLEYVKRGMSKLFIGTLWFDMEEKKLYKLVAPIGIPKGEYNGVPLHSCIFQINGLCELHDLGIKPTEGKLAHHGMGSDLSLRREICKLWETPKGDAILKSFVDRKFYRDYNEHKKRLEICQ